MTTIGNMQKAQAIITQTWSDESLKTRLLNDPKPVLAEYGLKFPGSMEVQVHENTSSLMNYVLPPAGSIPSEAVLEEMEPVARDVMKLALADETFKTELLSHPKPVIEEAMGLTLPDSLEIRVYEDTPTVKHLVLPVNPASNELSDFELEAIAGGKGVGESVSKIACGGASSIASGVFGDDRTSSTISGISTTAEGFGLPEKILGQLLKLLALLGF